MPSTKYRIDVATEKLVKNYDGKLKIICTNQSKEQHKRKLTDGSDLNESSGTDLEHMTIDLSNDVSKQNNNNKSKSTKANVAKRRKLTDGSDLNESSLTDCEDMTNDVFDLSNDNSNNENMFHRTNDSILICTICKKNYLQLEFKNVGFAPK